jgi:hypothetical protein
MLHSTELHQKRRSSAGRDAHKSRGSFASFVSTLSQLHNSPIHYWTLHTAPIILILILIHIHVSKTPQSECAGAATWRGRSSHQSSIIHHINFQVVSPTSLSSHHIISIIIIISQLQPSPARAPRHMPTPAEKSRIPGPPASQPAASSSPSPPTPPPLPTTTRLCKPAAVRVTGYRK